MFLTKLLPKSVHKPDISARELLRYLGPGILVTVGFIDPGNWAANISAGSLFSYELLWIVTLATIMLIILQHNVAHLGIATGDCLAEAAAKHLPRKVARLVLCTAIGAAVSTAVAEVLGMAIALNILAKVPLPLGAAAAAGVSAFLLYSNAYKRLEKLIIGFVSLIGFSFLFELYLAKIDWIQAASCWVTPAVPPGSLPIIMSVLGAVVMPHNLFLHSEIIQSRQWNLEDESLIQRQLKYEFLDTLFSMIIGWAINSAMILIAAATFFQNSIPVDTLNQASEMLRPLLGNSASVIFAVALLFAGLSSTTTAGMAGGSIFAGMFQEPYNIRDSHTRWGVAVTYGGAVLTVFFIDNPLSGLVISQILLSIQLPITIFAQIHLTSSKSVMGKYANPSRLKFLLLLIAVTVTVLNFWLFIDIVSK